MASFTGCAAPPRVTLTPRTDGSTVWAQGQPVVFGYGDNATVSVAYDHQEDSLLAFRVTVVNTGTAPFEIDSRSLYYTTCTASEACRRSAYPIDSEKRLAELDKMRRDIERDASARLVLGTTLLVLTALGEASSSRADRHVGYHPNTSLGPTMLMANANDDHALERIESERRAWEANAWRRTTIAPGATGSGFYYLALRAEPCAVRLVVQAGGQRFGFVFDQQVATPP